MIRIAVVGDIGSGKSHVAKQFGYPVFNADSEVAKLYKENKKCYKKLKKVLPNYITSFPVKKNSLSKAIMDNKINLKKVIKIIHPEIRVRMKNFIRKNQKKNFVVLDIPLFLENKINKKTDIIIFIDAKKKDINKKLKKRYNTNPQMIRKLRKIQLPVELKKKKSDYIIKNNFRNNYTKKNVKIVLNKILSNV